MSEVIIYHNPRCSKSRQTLEIIRDNNIEPIIVEYLKEAISESDIKNLLKKLDAGAIDIIRVNESDYKDNIAGNDQVSDDELIKYIVQYPKIMQRPIVEVGDKAVIGRPPENVLTLLP